MEIMIDDGLAAVRGDGGSRGGKRLRVTFHARRVHIVYDGL